MGHGGENQSQLSFTSWLICNHLSGLSDPSGRLATPLSTVAGVRQHLWHGRQPGRSPAACPAPCSTDACPSPLQVVHSRTFGTGARDGGIGVRMLLPVMDLLNHSGDEADFLLSDTVRQTENVRWVAFHATAKLVQFVCVYGVKAALLHSTAPELPWPNEGHVGRPDLKSQEEHHCRAGHAYHR